MSKGMPMEQAANLSPDEMMAWLIAFGEADGAKWDWQRLEWKKAD